MGVRHSTPDSLCYVEAGIPPVKTIILEAQAKFLRKMMPRMDVPDDPLGFALHLIEKEVPSLWDNIQSLISTQNERDR